jgi:hypothetical protein
MFGSSEESSRSEHAFYLALRTQCAAMTRGYDPFQTSSEGKDQP